MSETSSLCLACGFCCNGVLFTRVTVHPDEIERVRALGLVLETFRDGPGFRQPCSLYRESCCSVYPHHPIGCRAYHCKLLKKYLAGTVTHEQAAQTIQSARELLAAAIAQLPPGYDFGQLLREINRDSGRDIFGSVEQRRQNAGFMLAIGRLMIFSQKHFGESKEADQSR
jgi:Fe-S-cluster containining protein